MPTIPISQGPQRQSGAFRAPSAQQADVSSGTRAIGQALENVGEVAFKEAQRQSAIKAFEVDSRVREEWNALDAELRAKYQGVNSGQYLAEAQKWWDEAPGRVSNDVPFLARESVGKSLANARSTALAGAQAFHAGEQNKVLDQTFNSSLTNIAADGLKDLTAYDAQGRSAKTTADMAAKIAEYGAARGLPKEAVEAATAKYVGAYQADVVRRLMNTDLKAAKAYLTEHSKTIGADQYTALEKALQETTDGALAVSAVDETLKAHGGLRDNAAIEWDKMDATLRERFKDDPKQLAAARSELNVRRAAHREAESERNGDKVAAVMDAFSGGASLARIKQMPEYQALGGKNRADIDQRILTFTEARANAGEAAYRRQQAQLERKGFEVIGQYADPAALAAVPRGDIAQLRPTIGDDATLRLLARWDQVNKAMKEGKLAKVTTDATMMNGVAEQIGLEPFKPKKTEEDRARLGRFNAAVEDAIAAAQRAQNRELTYEEKKDIATKTGAATVRIEGWFTSRTEPAAALNPRDPGNVAVPKEDRESIIRNLRARNIQPTEAMIRDYYVRGQVLRATQQ